MNDAAKLVTLEAIHSAAKRIAPYVRETPMVAMTPSGYAL